MTLYALNLQTPISDVVSRYNMTNAHVLDHQVLLDGMSRDGLHPSLKGYQVWADALKPLLIELLGPPAKEDHAPPPTGDPSAASKPK